MDDRRKLSNSGRLCAVGNGCPFSEMCDTGGLSTSADSLMHKTVILDKGDFILIENDFHSYAYIVQKGYGICQYLMEDDEAITLGIMGQGGVFGDAFLYGWGGAA